MKHWFLKLLGKVEEEIAEAYTAAGLVKQSATLPSAEDHWRECGHWLDTGSGNGAITRAIVHFN